MTSDEPSRTATRRDPGLLVAGMLVVIAAMAAARGHPLPAPPSLTADPLGTVVPREVTDAETAAAPGPMVRLVRPSEHRGRLGEADGAVPAGTTVFDDDVAGVINLDPALLGALRRAAADAKNEGVELFVKSGWRSPEYQEQLLREAVSKYRTEEEAARWVATPSTSAHVSGDAVDIGPSNAAAWLSKHGARYGLCQIYRNEPWHFELRPAAVSRGCPAMYADPKDDPRMQ